MQTRANDIRLCHKCRHMNLKSMRNKFRKLDEEAKIKVGCQSYCGPCSRHIFAYINGRYVTGATEDEVVTKAARYLRKK